MFALICLLFLKIIIQRIQSLSMKYKEAQNLSYAGATHYKLLFATPITVQWKARSQQHKLLGVGLIVAITANIGGVYCRPANSPWSCKRLPEKLTNIWVHKLGSLPDWRNFLSNMLHAIIPVSLIGEEIALISECKCWQLCKVEIIMLF